MAVITAIGESRGLVTIYADGKALIRVLKKDFDKRPLAAGDEVDFEKYMDAMAAIQFSGAYEAALTMLDFSMRTSQEVRRALMRKGYVAPAADAAVQKLTEVGLIDDSYYARRMAEAAVRKGAGIYSIRRKMAVRGIAPQDSDTALAALDDEQQRAAARATAAKLARKYAGEPARQARAKLSQALARRGFSWDAISGALEDIYQDDEI